MNVDPLAFVLERRALNRDKAQVAGRFQEPAIQGPLNERASRMYDTELEITRRTRAQALANVVLNYMQIEDIEKAEALLIENGFIKSNTEGVRL